MKILIAGLGSIGRRHLRNLVALGESDIVLYRTRQSTLPDYELDSFPVETDLRAALKHKPEAVIVSNPTALHMDVAVPAACSGCHLLLEKPISHNLNELASLKAALDQGGGQVLVGFQYRYHPGLQQAARLLTEGAIGRPLSVHAHWGEFLPNWHPWEDYRLSYSARSDLGGGVVLTLSHPFDYLRWLFGEVNSVWALTGRLGDLQLDVEDTAEIVLQFQSGMVASLHLDYNQQPPAHYLEVVGSQGTLRWDNNDGIMRWYQPDVKSWLSISPPEGFERNRMFLDEMRHFLAVARGEQKPICTLFDGQRALELALAAHRSEREGQRISV